MGLGVEREMLEESLQERRARASTKHTRQVGILAKILSKSLITILTTVYKILQDKQTSQSLVALFFYFASIQHLVY